MMTDQELQDYRARGEKLEDAIATLKRTKTAYALTCCRFVNKGWGDLSDVRKFARLALAADKGETKAVLNYLEGKF